MGPQGTEEHRKHEDAEQKGRHSRSASPVHMHDCERIAERLRFEPAGEILATH